MKDGGVERLLALVWPWQARVRRTRLAWAEAARRLGLVYRAGDSFAHDRLEGTVGALSIAVYYRPDTGMQKTLTWFEVRGEPSGLAPDASGSPGEVSALYEAGRSEPGEEGVLRSALRLSREQGAEVALRSALLPSRVFIRHGALQYVSLRWLEEADEMERTCRDLLAVYAGVSRGLAGDRAALAASAVGPTGVGPGRCP